MWALIAGFTIGGVTVVVLRVDPTILGFVAGIFILGCLVLCGVMATLDSRQARATDITLEALDASPLSPNLRPPLRNVKVAGSVAASVSSESHRLPDPHKRGAP